MKTHASDLADRHGLTLVLGGTGKSGRRIVERLHARGIETRVASRAGTPAFDWDDSATWAATLEGVTAAWIAYAPDLAIPGATDTIRDFVAEAVAGDVRHLVLLSGRGEAEAQACERIVRDAGVEWTIVRASWFMQNFSEGAFLDMISAGNLALPAGDVPEPFVDVDDIADVAVAALTQGGHAGRIYEVTGPRLLTLREVAREISLAAGREVRFTGLPNEAFERGLAEAGVPKNISWLLGYLFETVLDGRNASLGDGVQRALGRPARDFSDYAARAASEGVWSVADDAPAA